MRKNYDGKNTEFRWLINNIDQKHQAWSGLKTHGTPALFCNDFINVLRGYMILKIDPNKQYSSGTTCA